MPAKSKSQQRLFGMVHAYKQGKLKNAPKKIKDVAKHISDEDAKDFAKTKSSKLPEKKASPNASGIAQGLEATGNSLASATGGFSHLMSLLKGMNMKDLVKRRQDEINKEIREYNAMMAGQELLSRKKEPPKPISEMPYMHIPSWKDYIDYADRPPWAGWIRQTAQRTGAAAPGGLASAPPSSS